MNFNFPIPQYCERGAEAALWAEPLNALSNIAFFIAAGLAVMLLLAQPSAQRSRWHYLLLLLASLIGVGSSLYHIFADRWSLLTDIVPIYLFMFSFQIFALAKLLRLPNGQVALWTVIFVLACYGATLIKCSAGLSGLLPFPIGTDPGGRCLNGSLNYVPALIAMLTIGGVLKAREHPAANLLLAAGGTFFISLAFRTVDWDICNRFVILGQNAGGHWIWHVLNGAVLYLLLKAAIEYAAEREDSPEPAGSPI